MDSNSNNNKDNGNVIEDVALHLIIIIITTKRCGVAGSVESSVILLAISMLRSAQSSTG